MPSQFGLLLPQSIDLGEDLFALVLHEDRQVAARACEIAQARAIYALLVWELSVLDLRVALAQALRFRPDAREQLAKT